MFQGIRNLARGPVRRFSATLLAESLSPGKAAAAIFLGVFLAHVPIYGFQTLTAVALAAILRLNKPLTVAATFVNNPLLQPVLMLASVMLGRFLLTGGIPRLSAADLTRENFARNVATFVVGSLSLGLLLASVAAGATFLLLRRRDRQGAEVRRRRAIVNTLFAGCLWYDRGFVRWKLRLDRVFDLLAAEDLGSGPAIDLGCGYGITLGFAACGAPWRPLVGCDLDARRIAAAREAFRECDSRFEVADVRRFEIPPAGLVMILDVLQYLDAAEQIRLLERCCTALVPGGRLIFRVHDRGRALYSKITLAFDRLIFAAGGVAPKPAVLSLADYRRPLAAAGLAVREIPFRNRLPLAHVLLIAQKPAQRAAS